jgi:hypothetical protein
MGCMFSSSATVSRNSPEAGKTGSGRRLELVSKPASTEDVHILLPPSPARRCSSSSNSLAGIVPERVDKDVRTLYQIDNTAVLGFGASGVVKECVSLKSGRKYALKSIQKSNLRQDAIERLRLEIAIMQEVDHPNILRLSEVFEDADKIYLISELCKGGDLCDQLDALEGDGLREQKTCRYVYQIVSAVRYLHAHSIIHRELKLDNFLLEEADEKAELQLTGKIMIT